MNNSLNRLIDGIIIALEREIIPRVDDAYARGQAFAVMDLLRNMRPRLEWSREVTLAQVTLQEAALGRVDDLCRGQVERPPAYEPPAAPSITLGTKELEARRDRLEAEVCGVLKWLTEHRTALDAAVAKSVEETITNYMREAVRRELALTANPLFAEISRGANA
ncbi:MAG TPA: hypothetical protein VNF49_02335 [Candidatus Binataceae bacterium]|nr:hypothetical protein [Candidatus Binataceae bacterium]